VTFDEGILHHLITHYGSRVYGTSRWIRLFLWKTAS